MRPFKYFGLAVAAFVVLAVTASSALAVGAPSMLSVKTPQAVTGAGAGVELQTLSGLSVGCSGWAMEASLTTENKGTFHASCGNAKASSPAVACTGKDGTVKDATGVILWLGTFKIVHDVTATGSTYAILFELNPDTEFECSALAKIVILGTFLCLFVEPTVGKESHIFNCKNSSTVGDPQETKYWYEGVEGIASLLVGLNGGKEESAAEIASETFVTTGSLVAVVMN